MFGRPNFILQTDSYKISHWRQYPPGTTNVYSFFESRGGKFPNVTFFGLQYIIKNYLTDIVVCNQDIEEAKEFFKAHFGRDDLFNEAGWRIIVDEYGGKLPITIRAVPEGTTVPTGNVLMTVENDDERLPWLTNYVETLLSQVWYPCTVATQSREMRRVVEYYLEKTGTPGLIDFKVHDFGYRGSTSEESSAIGGAAHLTSFMGTDTMSALRLARKFYGGSMAGFSIPAMEHSTVTSWGRENEAAAYDNMLFQFPTGIIAAVSDSYNIYDACSEIWGDKLKDKVLARDGVLVIRPDSGEPVSTVITVLNILAGKFGSTKNEKGYWVLNPKVRVIQGDGIDYRMIESILSEMAQVGLSADNIAFGSGGGLLQKMDRDTQRFAFKCSAIKINGVWQDVMKDPVGDASKRSKAGRFSLIKDEKLGYKTIKIGDPPYGEFNQLRTVFSEGTLFIDDKFRDIRWRARQ